ncbi:MAG: PAAR domain-containing protein [Planctomycetota bacterium]
MGKPAARMTDQVLQDSPHCHAPIHPPAPTPTPVPHPPVPLMICKGEPTVLIGGQPAARVTDQTLPCMGPPPCIPAGPGMIAMGSTTVLIGKMPAARMGDMTAHASCVAPIPGPTGKILPPCCPTVLIGG